MLTKRQPALATVPAKWPESGFTLVELMVTLTVASILLLIAVPAFRSVTAGNRLTTQANDLVAAINLARSEAIKRNATITFCRAEAADATECAGDEGEWEHWIVSTPDETVIRTGSINTYGGSILVESTLDNDEAAFGADGLARTGGVLASDQELTVCSSGITRDNLRRVVIGAGSRLATQVDTVEEC